MTTPPDAEGEGSPLDAAYRAHLADCSCRHLGILADCPEGARLRALSRGEDPPAGIRPDRSTEARDA
ncbi:hypothetical protein C9F11_47030 (plasmid) [Streptomyces sp. YIM 121038]|uniref:hypothetical protein n=1 Tax=Streptomyces sp. YIM 121038 TaxID=2136401 RepID=UPI001110D4AA|nr:hypothetical protein [Streptomyces sp. YIM 121038]QCX82953.1 hypothetical protein C9F11_47030 [Streptomyces sp. YIM 121038]